MASSITTFSPSTLADLRAEAISEELAGLAPTPGPERLELLDILRGFALFGVLLSNLVLVTGEALALGLKEAETWTFPGLDERVTDWLHFLVQNKFIVLFTLLFGISFALQTERARLRGNPATTLSRRRMLWLLLFGMAHGYFLWWGDILSFYAVVGLVLLLFRRAPDGLLLGVGSALLVVPAFLYQALVRLSARPGAPDASMIAAHDEQLRSRFATFVSGASPEFLWRENLMLFVEYRGPLAALFMIASILAFFLLGYFLGRRRLLYRISANRRLITHSLIRLLPLALAGNLAMVVTFRPAVAELATPWMLSLQLLAWFGIPALSLVYLLGLALLYESSSGLGRRMLRLLAPVGRMSLSNYLFQSVAFVFLLYHFRIGGIPIGLGWLGELGATACLPVATGIFALQILFSHWWSNHFDFGPAEWLWRCLSYGRVLPNRRGMESIGGKAARSEAGGRALR